jgi:hypothetical protein
MSSQLSEAKVIAISRGRIEILPLTLLYKSAARPAADVSMSPDDPAFLGVELVRSLGLIAATLQTDERARMEIALACLRTLARLATRARSQDVWLVIELTTQVADRFAAQSLWRCVTPLRQRMAPEGAQRLAAYVRAMFNRDRGLLWPSQREGVSRLAESSSFALCTPQVAGFRSAG